MKPANHFPLELPELLSEPPAPWSAENILAEISLIGGGNANESIDT
jgi:hypothetical protein